MGWLTFLSTVATVGGSLLSARNARENARAQQAWGTYNRSRDIIDLNAFQQRMDDQNALLEQQLGLSDTRRVLLQGERDLAQSEVDYYNLQARWHRTDSDSRAREFVETKRAELGVRTAALDVASANLTAAQVQNQVDVDNTIYQGRLAQAERRGVEETTAAGRAAVAAQAERLGVGAGVRGRGLMAREVELAVTSVFERGELIREAAGEMADIEVGAAVRGIGRGSVVATQQARVAGQLGRELGVLQARTDVAGVELEGERAIGAADDEVTAARLRGDEASLAAGLRTGRARFGARWAELSGRRSVLGAQAYALGAQALHLGAQRRQVSVQDAWIDPAAARMRAEGELRASASEISGASAEHRRDTVTLREGEVDLEDARARMTIRHNEMARQTAQWSLDNMPALPDYIGAGNRSAMGHLLSAAGSMAFNW